LRKSSPPESASVLIAAISGRSLASAARRAGLVPLVADFFADADTCLIAHGCQKLKGRIGRGIEWKSLGAALDELARQAHSPILGCVYGSGFEDRPELLDQIAASWPLLGNDAQTVARVKAPGSFFAALDRLGIAHPRTQTDLPPGREGWLVKRQGGAGGSHIVSSQAVGANARRRRAAIYFQEMVAGRPISVLFVADGERACVLGFSEQWTAPIASQPFRYGGAIRPATLPQDLKDRMILAVEQAATAFVLQGLGSADFLVDDAGTQPLLLEINPRPGATLDIFDTDTLPLFRLHLDAVLERKLPHGALDLPDAAASAIVYAPETVTIGETMRWPDWTADRPKARESIDKNRPICTVSARAKTKASAKRLVSARMSKILAACAAQKRGEE
jgi:predicted ATP-grasp superfamily ATP-dependent carboligase